MKNSNQKPSRIIRHTLLATAIAQALMSPLTQAANIVVTSGADNDAECTLREAVESINNGILAPGCTFNGAPLGIGDTILFQSNVSRVTLTQGGLVVNNDMRILALVGDVTIEKTPDFNSSLLFIDGDHNVDINRLTFFGNETNSSARGSGIRLEEGTLTLRNSVITGGTAGTGGGLYVREAVANLENTSITGNSAPQGAGGGIRATRNSTVTLTNSNISGNRSNSSGGGIDVDYGSRLVVNGSTISGNAASSGGGINAQRSGTTLIINQSLIAGNVVSAEGGGIRLNNQNPSATISNSTIYSNSAGTVGGGIRSRDGLVTVVNSTITHNAADSRGAGVYASGLTDSFNLRNSIIANSFESEDCSIRVDRINANRQNIIEDGSCETSAMSVNPQLEPIADNGGPTLTHALRVTSPAISAGSNAVCAASPINSVDQRGEPRANPDDTICDLGAFESEEGRADTSTFFVIPTQNGGTVAIEL